VTTRIGRTIRHNSLIGEPTSVTKGFSFTKHM
jgi:hypothetical protein